jgi:gas vesicle protein
VTEIPAAIQSALISALIGGIVALVTLFIGSKQKRRELDTNTFKVISEAEDRLRDNYENQIKDLKANVEYLTTVCEKQSDAMVNYRLKNIDLTTEVETIKDQHAHCQKQLDINQLENRSLREQLERIQRMMEALSIRMREHEEELPDGIE